ncbi:MAG: hypothetical protein HOQ05_05570 [Corynebacteriales bacterium]|nr:hypothetical protein [Mycobacteriales bacterium]
MHDFRTLEIALGKDGYRIDSELNIIAAQDPEATKAWYEALEMTESTALNIVLNLETDRENLAPRQEIPRAKTLVQQASRLLLAGVPDNTQSSAVASFEGLSASALAAIPDPAGPLEQEPAPDSYHAQAGALKAWDDAARQLNPIAALPPSEWRQQPRHRR